MTVNESIWQVVFFVLLCGAVLYFIYRLWNATPSVLSDPAPRPFRLQAGGGIGEGRLRINFYGVRDYVRVSVLKETADKYLIDGHVNAMIGIEWVPKSQVESVTIYSN